MTRREPREGPRGWLTALSPVMAELSLSGQRVGPLRVFRQQPEPPPFLRAPQRHPRIPAATFPGSEENPSHTAVLERARAGPPPLPSVRGRGWARWKEPGLLSLGGLLACRSCCPAAPCAVPATRWCMMRRSWLAGHLMTPTSTQSAPSVPAPLCPCSVSRPLIPDPGAQSRASAAGGTGRQRFKR